MISTVTGNFNEFQAEVKTPGEDFSKASILAGINLASIDTGSTQRDEHLKSPDFFDVAQFPSMNFTAKAIKTLPQPGEYQITGDLTIRDTTKEFTFNCTFAGIAKDPYGNTKAGFSLEGTLNRKEFGLTWNVALETGVLVGDQVRILGEIQLIKA